MAQVVCETHMWTLKQPQTNQSIDFTYFSYYDKNEQTDGDSRCEEKRLYAESRGITWNVSNRRPYKLKDSLKQVEELLCSKKCLSLKWLSGRHLQMLLANGVIVHYMVSLDSGDINQIYIDKSLVGKVTSDHACDMLLTEEYVLISYSDRGKLDFIHFTKKRSADRKFEKLSSLEPKMSTFDIPGPLVRKLRRRLARSQLHNQVLCWWSCGLNDASPWMPMTGDKELANLVLLQVEGAKLGLVSYTRTPGDIVFAEFSRFRAEQVFTVEQTSTSHQSFDVLFTTYSKTSDNKIHRIATSAIPVKGQVTCADRSPDERRVVVGCSDGLIVLHDLLCKITHTTKADLVPASVRWHPNGIICLVSSNEGEIQLFDLTLSSIQFQGVSDDVNVASLSLGSHLTLQRVLQEAVWIPKENFGEKFTETTEALAFGFDKGPVGVVLVCLGLTSRGGFTALNLVNQYVRKRLFDQAVRVLRVLDWDVDGRQCYMCLSAVVNQLLKLPLDEPNEIHLYEALGCFYNSSRPLSEVSVLEFREPINHLARRFFHHLLRYGRFEKAFLLAVDIGAEDLFMDIHYAAKDRGENALSAVAFRRAREFNDRGVLYRAVSKESLDSLGHGDDDNLISYESLADYMVTSQRSQPRQPSYRDVAELVCLRLEDNLAAQFRDEFTEVFLNPKSDSTDVIEGPDELHSGAVQVINFGIV